MKVTILGAGAFGTALGHILEANYHAVNFYDPPKMPEIKLENAIKNADIIILATPSNVATDLLAKLPPDVPLISASKGFLSLDPFRRFSNFSILSGGSFAGDLEKKQPTRLTITSPLIAKLFKAPWLTFDTSDDLLGILLCGTFKNIFAIGAGLRKLSPDTPELTAYLSVTLGELRAVLASNNCDPQTAELACGKDDLFLTCSSSKSRNYQFGRELADGAQTPSDATVEGLVAIQSLSASSIILPPAPILTSITKQVLKATEDQNA